MSHRTERRNGTNHPDSSEKSHIYFHDKGEVCGWNLVHCHEKHGILFGIYNDPTIPMRVDSHAEGNMHGSERHAAV